MGLVVQNTPGGVIKIVQGGTTQVISAGLAQTTANSFAPPSGTGFIHITGGAMDGAARNPLASEIPGFDGVTVTGVPTSGQVPIASSGTAAAWGTVSIGPSTFTPGTAGQVLITNGSPTTVWDSTLLITPNTSISIAAASLSFKIAVASPTLSQATLTSDIAPQDITLSPQQPWASAATNILGGNVVVDLHTVGSPTLGPYLSVRSNAAHICDIGEQASTGYGSIWLHVTPTVANWVLLSDGTSMYLNAPGAAGNMFFGLGAGYYGQLNPSTFQWGATYATPSYILDLSTTAIFHFGVSAVTATIQYDAKTTNAVPPTALTIRGQYAWASATGVNRTPGSIVLDVGAPTNGASGTSFEPLFQFTRNGVVVGQFGYDSTFLEAHFWMGTPGAYTPSPTNTVFATDGHSYCYFNSPTNAPLGFFSGNSQTLMYFSPTINAGYFGGTTGAAPIVVTWNPLATPTIMSGTGATSLTIGTNKAGASFVMQGDAATTILTLSTFAEFATKVLVDQVAAPVAPAAGKFAIYMDSLDGKLKAISPGGTVTTLAAA